MIKNRFGSFLFSLFTKRVSGLLLSITCCFLSLQTFAQNIDSNSQKEVAKYDTWSVFINYSEISNIRCQAKTMAISEEKDYLGVVTIWKEKDMPVAEVGLFNVTTDPIGIPLEKEPSIHTLMIKNMSVKGIRRDTDSYMALFNIGNGMIDEMLEKDFATATLIDSKGKKHDLLIDLKGLKQAWNYCYPQK